jgi:hypothetical protein
MKFLVMVKGNAGYEAGAMPSERLMAEMGRFNEEMVRAGVMKAADGLHPSTKGTRILYDGDKRTLVDGPFGNAKEQVAGFWIIEVASKEEAIEWMKRAPAPHEEGVSEVEIRQIFGLEDFGPELTEQLREQEERLRKEMEGQ